MQTGILSAPQTSKGSHLRGSGTLCLAQRHQLSSENKRKASLVLVVAFPENTEGVYIHDFLKLLLSFAPLCACVSPVEAVSRVPLLPAPLGKPGGCGQRAQSLLCRLSLSVLQSITASRVMRKGPLSCSLPGAWGQRWVRC